MNSPVNISLIVSTYNWPEALHLSLLSIKRQVQLPLEVIIADDGSSEKTRTVIQKHLVDFPVPLRHIWQQDFGFRKCLILNKAIAETSGNYLVQVDGDTILNKYFIKDHQDLAEAGTFVRGTRAHIAVKEHSYIFRTETTDFNFLSKGIVNRFNALRLPALSFLLQKKSHDSHSVRGSNLAYWKQDYLLINGYNNDLQGWGHEDEELAARFVNNHLLKKTIKLKAVQFHLYHKPESREQETQHTEALERTRLEQLKTCANGYAQALNAIIQ